MEWNSLADARPIPVKSSQLINRFLKKNAMNGPLEAPVMNIVLEVAMY
jgi:hypothetical protein